MDEVSQLTSLDPVVFDELTDLLHDAVTHGASVGYVLPVDVALLKDYWNGVAREVSSGDICLLAARRDGRIVGSAQLAFCAKPNAPHRAEVKKVLVHSAYRRMGLGRALMDAAEQRARAHGRTLLVLDTESDSAGQRLYEAAGFVKVGDIPRFCLGTVSGWAATTYMYKHLDDAT